MVWMLYVGAKLLEFTIFPATRPPESFRFLLILFYIQNVTRGKCKKLKKQYEDFMCYSALRSHEDGIHEMPKTMKVLRPFYFLSVRAYR